MTDVFYFNATYVLCLFALGLHDVRNNVILCVVMVTDAVVWHFILYGIHAILLFCHMDTILFNNFGPLFIFGSVHIV